MPGTLSCVSYGAWLTPLERTYGSETNRSVSLMMRLGRPAIVDCVGERAWSEIGIWVNEGGMSSAPRLAGGKSPLSGLGVMKMAKKAAARGASS